ncbi:hypothetical protein F7Q99_21280 [Streptomyces kaniharaensis]|uniref:Uncharacterized protein n=1 Tax=Streptomyces kaniharaensis TaxID=212423 RepID=A0A6N7KV66_9ACTN|nr:hypothetical protein [Streptomyces kaniharaensis]MQS14725.1 hypothetical protein [Streptomyces kaniharaensis]
MPDPRLGHARFQPDIAIGRDPELGICAANPRQLAGADWMLERLGFQRVPDSKIMYALTDQHLDGNTRATTAVDMLRNAGYAVHADDDLDPEPASTRWTVNGRTEPDVAFAEHPKLGVVAATADTINAVERGGAILEAHGWSFQHALDVYTLPTATDRSEALGKLARATAAMQRAGDLQVAVQPQLAEAATRRQLAPEVAVRHESGPGFTTHRFPLNAAALAASPARTGVPGKAPAAEPSSALPAARPVDPRIAFARNR